MNTTTTTETTITMRAHAFGSSRVLVLSVMVERDGTVRVYDDVAGYFTTCHGLSASACRRARKLAAEVAS